MPGRLAAWPPGRLAAWPPGRLAGRGRGLTGGCRCRLCPWRRRAHACIPAPGKDAAKCKQRKMQTTAGTDHLVSDTIEGGPQSPLRSDGSESQDPQGRGATRTSNSKTPAANSAAFACTPQEATNTAGRSVCVCIVRVMHVCIQYKCIHML